MPMDTYQITTITLQAIVALGIIAGLVIGHRAIVRREAAGASLQKATETLLQRAVEAVAELKGQLPAIQRATGASHQSLTEVTGQLRTIDKSTAESERELVKLSSAISEGNKTMVEQAAMANKIATEQATIANKIAMALQELGVQTKNVENLNTDGVAATKRLGDEMAKLHQDLLAAVKL